MHSHQGLVRPPLSPVGLKRKAATPIDLTHVDTDERVSKRVRADEADVSQVSSQQFMSHHNVLKQLHACIGSRSDYWQ
jgi:hypothetical protein